jgi:hypothetical protein
MQFQPAKRLSSSILASTAIVLTVAGCSGHLTPLGPYTAPPPQRHLGAAIVLQVMRIQPAAPEGGCPAGWGAVTIPTISGPACGRKLGVPVTIASGGVSSVSELPSKSPSGQAPGPAMYGVTVDVPAADVAAVTAIIKQAYDSQAALVTIVAGKAWSAPQVQGPFPGRQLQIALLSENQADQLQHILVSPS